MDDHPLIREGLKYILESTGHIQVVGEAENGKESIGIILSQKPDLVLMDVNMPVLNGIEAVQTLKRKGSTSKFIMITGYDEINDVAAVFESGVLGYVLKATPPDELIKAVQVVYEGKNYVHQDVAAQLIQQLQQQKPLSPPPKEAFDHLTPREIDVLRLLGLGLSNFEIAQKLDLSEETIKNHVSRIFKKIEVRDRTKAALYAIRNKLVDIE